MTKEQAFAAIKILRNQINDGCEDDFTTGSGDGSNVWVNDVVYRLDQASDILEFGKARS